MPERLRLAFADFWPGFDPRDNMIRDALEQVTRTEIVNRNPDLLVYSVFGTRNLRHRGPKMLVNGEPHSIDYGKPDFSIGFHEPTDEARLRLPIWAWEPQSELLVPSVERVPQEGDGFCAFVYSNPSCEYRNRFYSALNRRRPVTALGALFRDEHASSSLSERNALDWRASKTEALRDYRFTVSFENVQMPGYSTEKLTDAFVGGSIPIYWGDPFIAEDFNSKAFIDSSSFSSYREVIEYVLWLDDDPAQRHAFRREAPMSEEQHARYFDGQLVEFLRVCIGQEPRPAAFYMKRAAACALSRPPRSRVDTLATSLSRLITTRG